MDIQRKITVNGLSGLKNIGNTCYLNAVIQSLSSCKYLLIYLFKKDYTKSTKYNISKMLANNIRKQENLPQDTVVTISKKELEELYETTLINKLRELLETIWTENCVVIPLSFKVLLGKLNETFNGCYQNDSHEVLSYILDRIHEETRLNSNVEFTETSDGILEFAKIKDKVKCVLKNDDYSIEVKKMIIENMKDYINNNLKDYVEYKFRKFWKRYVEKNSSIITDLFTGVFCSSVECLECSNKSIRFETFTILQLSIPENDKRETIKVTIYDCIKNEYLTEEKLHGMNQYMCSFCEKLVDAIKKVIIYKTPCVFIIQLKRFKNMNGRLLKNREIVEFPIEKFNDIYDLVSVIKHVGSVNNGHYYTNYKHPINGKWYEFNDTCVTYLEDPILCTSESYILFYQKNLSIL